MTRAESGPFLGSALLTAVVGLGFPPADLSNMIPNTGTEVAVILGGAVFRSSEAAAPNAAGAPSAASAMAGIQGLLLAWYPPLVLALRVS